MSKWIKKDLKYNWHPYTQMKDCERVPPILIERAKGIKLYDEKGNFYYDTISSWWCNVHGHNHPRIKEAVIKQIKALDHVLFAGFTHKGAILLSEKLISIAPKNISKVFFSDNGSTAVETALKMSLQYWKNTGKKNKTKFISLDYGYHGDTVGAMSVSGISLFNEIFTPLLFESIKVPSPYCYRCPMGKERFSCVLECIKPLEAILKKRHDEISAIILEPLVMAAGGMIIYPEQYLDAVSKLAGRFDIHLIIDEVATGFGRTGKMFACEYTNAKPDFICISKGITSGCLPLAATLTSEKIYQAFYDDYEKMKTFYHGHTYTANPVSCSAALASLDIFSEEKVFSRLKDIIPVFHKAMESFRSLPLVGDVRYKGMIAAIELVEDRHTKKNFNSKRRLSLDIYKMGLDKQLVLRPLGDIIYLFLPLCVRKKELEYILEKTYYIIKSIKTI